MDQNNRPHLSLQSKPSSKFELPPLIVQARDACLSIMLSELSSMFQSCDDLFFELSGRAKTNAEQNMYFESMREVRFNKLALSANFKQQMDLTFAALSDPKALEALTDRLAKPTGNLALIENDQLEQEVAYTSMATKVRNKYQEALYHLSCRFDYLVEHLHVTEKNNPLAPEQICAAFAEACKVIDLDIKARIILLKQFDRHVIDNLGKTYEHANELLKNSGVLPRIGTPHAGKDKTRASKQQKQETQQQRYQQATPNVELSQLRNLLSNIQALNVRFPSIISLLPNYQEAAPPLNTPELLKRISKVTLKIHTKGKNAKGEAVRNTKEMDIRGVIQQIFADSTMSAQPKSLARLDEDVINLVAMFFDYVLSDKSVPADVKVLLGRLQFPVLHLALEDKDFFRHADHPARQLINEIARGSVGWTKGESGRHDQLLEHIQGAVEEILNHYLKEPEVFDKQLKTFHEFIKRDQHKAALIEKRASQAKVGKLRAEHTQEKIRALMAERMDARQLPAAVEEFLNKQWMQVLSLLNLREGERSAASLDALQLVDDLIWMLQAHTDQKSLARREKLLPGIEGRIKTHLNLICTSQAEIQTAMDPVLAAIRLEPVRDESVKATPAPSIPPNTKAEPAPAPAAPPADGKAETNSNWSAQSAVDKQRAQEQKVDYKYIQMTESFPIDSWFTMLTDGTATRYKLAAKLEDLEIFVFVKRFGTGSLEKTRREFARDLKHKRVIPINREPLFERTFYRISKHLLKLTEEKQVTG